MTTTLDTPRRDRRAVNGGAPAIGGGYALRRYWFIPLILAVLLGAAGLVYARTKTPVYTASAQLAVGTSNVNTPEALGGFATSGPVLAAAYSRAVYADQVTQPIASKLGRPLGAVRGHLNATVIPTTPVIRVDATGSSAGDAVTLANAAADRLAGYAGTLNGTDASSSALLAKYRQASADVSRASSKVNEAESTSLSSSSSSVSRAKADLALARLKQESLATAYRNSQQGLGASNPLQVLEKAIGATSNRNSKLQLYAVSGAIAGLILGWALAILAGNRRLRRNRRFA